MRSNSSKRNSKEDIVKNVNTIPSFQKLQDKILTLQQQQQKNECEMIQQCLSQESNKTSTQSNQFNRYRDIKYEDYGNAKQDEYVMNKTDGNEYAQVQQHLYDPMKQEKIQATIPVKPPRCHTPTRRTCDTPTRLSHTPTRDSKNIHKTDTQKSSKSLRRHSNNSRSKGSSKGRSVLNTSETSPSILGRQLQPQLCKEKKEKIEIGQQNDIVSEKDKKIIQNIQKKLKSNQPITNGYKENRAPTVLTQPNTAVDSQYNISKLNQISNTNLTKNNINTTNTNDFQNNTNINTFHKNMIDSNTKMIGLSPNIKCLSSNKDINTNMNYLSSFANINAKSCRSNSNLNYALNSENDYNSCNLRMLKQKDNYNLTEEEDETNLQYNFLSNLKNKLDKENEIIDEQVLKIDQKKVDDLYSQHSEKYKREISQNKQNKQNERLVKECEKKIVHKMQHAYLNPNSIAQSTSHSTRKNTLSALDQTQANMHSQENSFQLRNNLPSSSYSNLPSSYSSNPQNEGYYQFDMKENNILSNSSSIESFKQHKFPMMQNSHQKKETLLKDLVKVVDTRATSCKSMKQSSHPFNQETEFKYRVAQKQQTDFTCQIEERNNEYNLKEVNDQALSSYSQAQKSNKNSQILSNKNSNSASSQIKTPFSKQDNLNSLYQVNEYSSNKFQYTDIENESQEKKRLESTALCSTQRQCNNDQFDTHQSFKLDIGRLQQDNSQIKNQAKQKENQNYYEKQSNESDIIQLQYINQTLKMQLKQKDDFTACQKRDSSQAASQIEFQLRDQLEQLQLLFNKKEKDYSTIKKEYSQLKKEYSQLKNEYSTQKNESLGLKNESQQLKNELNSIQQIVNGQMEKSSNQSAKIKNLEQLISEYSKIEQRLFQLEDEHEELNSKNHNLQIQNKDFQEKYNEVKEEYLELSENHKRQMQYIKELEEQNTELKNNNDECRQSLIQNEQFELKQIQIMNEIKKCSQIQKSKVVEFGQIIDAYLKLTECIITNSEPSLDVLVGHRRKRNSFLEIKKQDDNSCQNIQGHQNIQQKITEQCDFIINYTKGSSERVQIILDQSRTLLDQLSDYYITKYGTGVL